jgi:hypothetical protein
MAFVVTLPCLLALDVRLTGSGRTILPTPLAFIPAALVIGACAQLAPLVAPWQYFAAPPDDPPEVSLTLAEPEHASADEPSSMAAAAEAAEPPLENSADESVPSLREPAP